MKENTSPDGQETRFTKLSGLVTLYSKRIARVGMLFVGIYLSVIVYNGVIRSWEVPTQTVWNTSYSDVPWYGKIPRGLNIAFATGNPWVSRDWLYRPVYTSLCQGVTFRYSTTDQKWCKMQ